ncbi:MAG: hypothetical protein KatS3mg102_2105 [Planctomycetota bacterium]|nr:MAG: hypothetical protein KatS3mg102_2105 [Planctomycetota bacterium]
MRRAAGAGFTLVELLGYLGLLSVMTVVMLGAEAAARRVHRYEDGHVRVLQQVQRAFGQLAADLAVATAVAVAGEDRLSLQGGPRYERRGATGELVRDGVVLLGGVRGFRAEVRGAARALVHVTLELGETEAEARTVHASVRRRFEQAFFLPNAALQQEGGAR